MGEEIKGLVNEPEPKKEPEKVKLPDGIVKELDKITGKKQQLVNSFVNLSFKLVALQKKQHEVAGEIRRSDKDLRKKLDQAYKKLKLNKKKNYSWRFDGKDTFLGFEIPKPKEK